MAYREIGMWEILEVLRRVARGERRRAIERVTGHSRNTIRRWLRAARKLGWEPGQGEPDEALAAAVAQRVRPVRDEVSPGSSQARLLPVLVKYSELAAIVYVFRPQVQVSLRGTIGAVLSHGSLNGRTATRRRPPQAATREPRCTRS